jgi:alcohol dehydrogenase class IV
MDILQACRTLRHCNEAFAMRQNPSLSDGDAVRAVQSLKHFLERARADGKPIPELEIAPPLLYTREGMQWVMPFVLSAEAMLAHERRRQSW